MTAGRPRKPNELHKLEGTARSDRGTDVIVPVTEELAATPKLHNLTKLDRKETFKMFEAYTTMTGACALDTFMLSMMVDQLEIYCESKKLIAKEGRYLPTKDGGVYVNPAQHTMRNAMESFHKMAKEYGMTPATRSQLVAKVEEKSEIENLLEGI